MKGMKSDYFLFVVLVLFLQSCGQSEMKKREMREVAIKDSIENVKQKEFQIEQAKKDSIALIEQEIAIGEIQFRITEKEFEKSKKNFLKKCELPEFEFYKGLTIFMYKIGEYGFSRMDGWFHNDVLYDIKIHGPIVKYDEYDRVMPDQHQALMNILIKKYGDPSQIIGLPRWTDLEKGYFRRCAIWNIGTKRIEVQVACEGVEYYFES
jgi:hypothetical protein